MIRIIVTCCLLRLAACLNGFPSVGWLPHGPWVNDQVLQTDHHTVVLGQSITVFGKGYNSVVISKDGLVSFGRVVEYEAIDLASNPRDQDNDIPFVAPFYHHGKGVAADNTGKIYYRLITANDSTDTTLTNGTVGLDEFTPEVALYVTWTNVTDTVQSQSCTGTTGTVCQRASFQVALIASSEETFVSVKYHTMDIPSQPFYKAGLNAGSGYGWTEMCDPCVADPTASDGFVFRLTKETPQRIGCSNGRSKLQVYPEVAMMFGGKLLEISGPCPQPNDAIYCRFRAGDTDIKTPGFSTNGVTVKCPLPRLTRRGFVSVSVSVDEDRTYTGTGYVYVVMPGPLPRSIDLSSGGWYDVTPESLTMTWDKTELSNHTDVKVDVKLIGYRETESETVWKDLATLASNTDNTGSFTFSPADFQCAAPDCDLFEVGLVEVALQTQFYKMANARVKMNAGVVPLGWYVNEAMKVKHGNQWPTTRCGEWREKDRVDMEWMEKLLYCPCNVDQALADFGRWQPDVGCNMFSTSATNCFYHKGAKHCVRSFQPSSTGAGNQCCYTDDGLLSYAADTYQGSTPDKGHDWGAYPYDKPGYVPSFSHWIEDVVTFYYCCLWNEYRQCDYYMEQRATRDCTGYRPSKAGTAFGDPHLMTFDGKTYNFGGKGDFTLVHAANFTLQGKFKVGKQTQGEGSMYNATTLTSIALRSSSSDRVEVRLAPDGLSSGRRLDVFVNGKIHLFETRATSKMDFDGVSVINFGLAVDSNNTRHDNFTILLQSGVGVQVAASHGLLHVIVNIPPEFTTLTSGLLGTWNDDTSDDFTTVDGIVIPADSTPAVIYNSFALTWKVTEEESLFAYHNAADDSFTPILSEPQLPESITDIDDVCQGNQQCRFDYIVTGSSDIGLASRMAYGWFADLQSFQRLEATCGLLDVPNASKDNYNYTLGNSVTLTGCRNGGALDGDRTYDCLEIGGELSWEPNVTAKCGPPKTTSTGKPGEPSSGTVFRASYVLLFILLFVFSFLTF